MAQELTLAIDSREKHPWTPMMETEVIKLDEGDYCLKELLEYEQRTGKKTIRIERKASPGELAINLGKLIDTFEREVKRLAEYDEKYLICEFTLDELAEFPKNSNLPENILYKKNAKGRKIKNLRMNGKFMLVRLDHLYRTYDLQIIYAGNKDNACNIAIDLLMKYYNGIEEKT